MLTSERHLQPLKMAEKIMAEDSEKKILLRKILVAVDSSSHSQAALEAAVVLARKMEADIHGVYVREERWSKVSRLPSISVVNTYTGEVSSFEDETLEDQVKLLRNRLQEQLKRISKLHQVKHTWQYTSGNVDEKILEASQETDLITIGLKGLSAKRRSPGRSARTIIQESKKPVLILKEGQRLGSRILSIYDGSEVSEKSTKLALQIAENTHSTVTLLDIRSDDSVTDEQNAFLRNLFMTTPVFIEIRKTEGLTVDKFLNYVNQNKFGLLLIPKENPIFPRYLSFILNHMNCPLLLMN